MYRRWNQVLNFLMGVFVGFFVSYAVYVYRDYRLQPELYAAQSAPWYTGVLLYGLITALLVAVCFLVKRILRGKMQK